MLENNGEWPFASNITKLAFHLKLELIRINRVHLKLMIKQYTSLLFMPLHWAVYTEEDRIVR